MKIKECNFIYDGTPTVEPIITWSNNQVQRKPYQCPVCYGKGIVSAGFYTHVGQDWTTSSTMPEQCRSCVGTGIVWG